MKHLGETPRDRSIERLVHRALDARAARAAGRCLDAETLAAWDDDALTSAERAAAEAHAADCSRCQALLAAMVRTAPSPAGMAVPQRRWSIAWLVPAVAAAAAFAVWVAIPSQHQQQATSVTVADSKASPQTGGPVAPPASPADETRAAIDKIQPQREGRLKAEPRNRAAGTAESSDDTRGRLGALQVKPPPSAALSANVEEQKKDEQTRAPADEKKGYDPFLAKALGAQRPAPIVEIVSSNPGSRWRIVGGRAVQRSMDGGSTWELQQTGVSGPLTAGTSPSPSVCWLVGPGGVVVLSTDGRSWRRVAFPETTDLSAVSATDDKTATVTTSDGRIFITTDGGETWGRTEV
jgi:hypothetical protein